MTAFWAFPAEWTALMLYLANRLGLRVLAVHVDSG